MVSQPDQCLTLIRRETTVVDEVRAVLFGLEGFEVLHAVEDDDGTLVVLVETIDPVLGCPDCGAPAGLSRGRPLVALRDLTSAGRRVLVWWRKHRNGLYAAERGWCPLILRVGTVVHWIPRRPMSRRR